MANRRQVSIFFLALFLLEVSGSIDLSNGDDVQNGHLTACSNRRPNVHLNRVPIRCSDLIFVCLDYQGDPQGQVCVPFTGAYIDGAPRCSTNWKTDDIITSCKRNHPQTVDLFRTHRECFYPFGKKWKGSTLQSL